MARSPKGTAHETTEERMLHRTLFFTDAVFAIVLTLMVLDLHPPPFDSPMGDAAALKGMASRFLALALSFAVISIFWMAHLNTVRRLVHFDWPTAIANLVFLFPISLLPFATSWAGRSFHAPFAWGIYCSLLVVISLANVALVLVVSRGAGRLVGGITKAEVRFRVARALIPAFAFGVGLAILFSGLLGVAQFCWVLIPPLGLLIERTLKPKDPSAA